MYLYKTAVLHASSEKKCYISSWDMIILFFQIFNTNSFFFMSHRAHLLIQTTQTHSLELYSMRRQHLQILSNADD